MDEAELREQLERHHELSFGWALSCCARQADEAEDVLQTVYLKILEGRARYDGQSSFKTWLFAVIRLTALDERRRHWLRRLRLRGYKREQPVTVEADRTLESSERLQAFRQALAKLPERQREVLHLVFYQELTVEEAASVMGVSLGSARTHYARGKDRLRTWLAASELFHERKTSPATLP